MPYVAHVARGRVLQMVLGSAAFVAVCLWGIGAFGPKHPPMPGLLAWPGIVFFGIFGLAWAQMLIGPSVRLRIDSQGIWCPSYSRQLVPWDAITGIRVRSNGPNIHIELDLADPTAHPPTGIMRFTATARINRATGHGDAFLPLIGTDANVFRIGEAIRLHRR
jgi:hypothetical protein